MLAFLCQTQSSLNPHSKLKLFLALEIKFNSLPLKIEYRFQRNLEFSCRHKAPLNLILKCHFYRLKVRLLCFIFLTQVPVKLTLLYY
jgi:hypothetical protein